MNLNYSSPCNPLGYGVAGLNILRELDAAGCSVAYFPIGEISASQDDAEMIQRCVNNQSQYDHLARSVRLWHQHDLAQHVGSGLRAGFPVFELDTFTQREIHHLGSMDRVLVCSNWAKDIVEKNVNELDVRVVPLGVDRSVFYDSPPQYNDTTVFLNIGKWEIRKGHDILVKAFNKAFEKTDDVELWMMNHNPFISEKQDQEWKRMYASSNMGEKVKFLDRVDDHKEVAAVMRASDCGVFPSRAEGWNLEALEMMSCGKQVILTDYSAHTEFCTDDNSSLIPIESLEEAYDGIWFKGQGQWASIGDREIEILADYMRNVYTQKSDGRDIINKGGIETSISLSWKNSAEQLIGALN